MNEEYLKGLHGYLGIEDDYDTWVNAIQGDQEYLKGLHGYLKIDDDFDTWNTAVFGGEVKKKKILRNLFNSLFRIQNLFQHYKRIKKKLLSKSALRAL